MTMQVPNSMIAFDGGTMGFKNRLINAAFAINQRAVSGTVTLAAGVYGHDRWKAGASGCTYTFSTSNNVTTLNITGGTLQQVIEGANLESGTYYLSWAGTATGRIASGSYGASGAVSAAVTGGANTTIEFSTGTLALPQFERSGVTAFDYRPVGVELALCQRYLPAINGLSNYALGQAYSTTQAYVPVTFAVPPRVAPTGITVSSAAHFSLSQANATLTACSAVAFQSAGTASALLSATVGSAVLVAGNATYITTTSASAQVLFTGCEL